ncbi:hypothetical protein LTR53_020191, partial [Teratosphaeriaceae sp. CCFEE 6253]
MTKLTQRRSRNELLPGVQASEAPVAAELAGRTEGPVDEIGRRRTPPMGSAGVAVVPPREEHGSKEPGAIARKPLPKLRKDKAAAKEEKRRSKGQHHEERDCVV